MRALVYTSSALKVLAKLPKSTRLDIVAKLERYAETGAGNVAPLVGRSGRRLRIGDYRALFTETDETIDVFAIGHRRDIYL